MVTSSARPSVLEAIAGHSIEFSRMLLEAEDRAYNGDVCFTVRFAEGRAQTVRMNLGNTQAVEYPG